MGYNRGMSSLPTVPFGTTDMAITRVGFGAWAIGGGDWRFGWGDQDDAESVAAIHASVEAGINWIDTAAGYGIGHSEVVVAEALAGIPEADRPLVFTKCGLVPTGNPMDPPRRVGTPDSVRAEAEASLKRLNVERIDLLQMHWPAAEGSLDDYWGTLVELKAEGKIRAAGLSNHDVAQLDAAEATGHVDSLQPPFSAVNRSAGGDVIPWCAEHGTGVIVYSPMQSGLLTGAFSKERVAALPDNDWRHAAADFTAKLDANLALADALKPIAQRHDTTQAAVAVAWTLAWPGVTAAIVGARRPDQIAGWLDATTLALTPQDLADIAAAITTSGAGQGPTRP
jgi:aryl-alcohol dehydrogenase-like predicted oxidoreductase